MNPLELQPRVARVDLKLSVGFARPLPHPLRQLVILPPKGVSG
jgi:hypothetical protein